MGVVQAVSAVRSFLPMIPSQTDPRGAFRLVLLVEDAEDQRVLTASRMHALGWNCMAHGSAESALSDPHVRCVQAVIADIVLGEGRRSGIDLIGDLRERDVRAPVVLVTAFADIPRLKEALNAGASHLLEKPFAAEDLRNVLEKVTRVDAGLTRLVDSALCRVRLTQKEAQVARLVLKGLTSKEIAGLLDNTEKTIKQHLTCLYGKLGVNGRAAFFHLVFPS